MHATRATQRPARDLGCAVGLGAGKRGGTAIGKGGGGGGSGGIKGGGEDRGGGDGRGGGSADAGHGGGEACRASNRGTASPSTRNSTPPNRKVSLSDNRPEPWMRAPLSQVPLVELRSFTIQPSAARWKVAWWVETPESSRRIALSGARPAVRPSVSGKRRPSGSRTRQGAWVRAIRSLSRVMLQNSWNERRLRGFGQGGPSPWGLRPGRSTSG